MESHVPPQAREHVLIAPELPDELPVYRPHRAKAHRKNAIAALFVLLAILMTTPAWAGTVTNTNDSGPGSLRDVIAAAAPGATIDFAVSGTITLTSGELFIGKSLTISGPGAAVLTIQRSTAAGTPNFRLFQLYQGTFTISGLTISNGRADVGGGIYNWDILALNDCVITGNFATDLGGGVGNSGTMTMSNCVINNNSVAGGPNFDALGGGVFNDGTLTASNCTVSNNSVLAAAGRYAMGGGVFNGDGGTLTADHWAVIDNSAQAGAGKSCLGGGVYNLGTLTFTNNSKISGNSATGGAGRAGGGGGIFNDGDLFLITSTVDANSARGGDGSSPGAGYGGGVANDDGTAALNRSTVSGNLAVGGAGGSGGPSAGGGISNDFGRVLVFNSTVSGNLLNGGAGDGGSFGPPHGGGIFNLFGTVLLVHSTISANIVPSGFPEDGGGIFNSDGSVEIKNTIVAANTASVELFNDDNGIFSSDGYNKIGTNSGITAGLSDQLDITAAQLEIGALQDNGGPTFTHALLCHSPAIDAGDGANAPATDQRGFARVVGSTIDIGAFEYSNTAPGITDCPTPIIVNCATASCQATLTVGVADPDGDPMAVVWSVDGTPVHTSFVPAGGISASFTASFALGRHNITITVSDLSQCSVTCSTTVEVVSVVLVTHPQIHIVTKTNGTDNDVAPGPKVLAGTTVTWTYIVTNPGDEALKNVSVLDDHSVTPAFQGGDANSNGLLDPGETWTYTASGTAVSGQYTNLGTANGTGNVNNGPVTHNNPDFYFGQNPLINIVVLTNGTDNDAGTGPQVEAFGNVYWTYIVTNPGNEPLKNVTVNDNVIGAITGFTGDNGNGLLDAGETWTIIKTGIAMPGQYGNIGTANGIGNVTGKPVTSSNPDHYYAEHRPETPCPAGEFISSLGGGIGTIDPGTGDLYIRYDQFPSPNDNSYGVNAVGWDKGHTFGDLVGSDKAGFQLRDPNGVIKLEFYIDYISATTVTAATPSGYMSLGPFGGSGDVVIGTLTPADLTWDTSLARNLNTLGYCRVVNSAANCTTGGINLLVNSPPTDAAHTNYVISNPALVNWDFHDTYFVTIKKAKLQSLGVLDANGEVVPGWSVEPDLVALHNSPAKPCPPSPDLQVTALSTTSPAAPGSTITVTDTTKNLGTGPADASTTYVYFSLDSTLDSGDSLIGNRSVAALASSSSSSGSTQVTIPANATPGTWYLIVLADGGQSVDEPIETNNTRSTAITIALPDLQVSALSATTLAAPGSAISVTDTTKNLGTVPAAASTTFVYLSFDTVLDSGDTLIGNRSVAALASNTSSAGSTQATIPVNVAPGVWYVIVLADGGKTVAETIETNNTRSAAITIALSDLQVSTLSAPTSAAAGSAITVTDTTKNFGTAPAADSTTFVYFSLDTILDSGDALIGNHSVVALASGSSKAGSAQATIPANAAPGTWYLIVSADGGKTVPESVETNNTMTALITITGPDLQVSALSAPSSAAAGSTISVTDTTKNFGTAPAADSTTFVYFSLDGILDSGDTLIGNRSIVGLGSGISSAGSTQATIPANATPGTWYLIARADGGQSVSELIETNNTATTPITIAGPDLQVPALSAPTIAVPGTAITVTDTTKNFGTAPAADSTTFVYLSLDATLDPGDTLIGNRPVAALAAGISSAGSAQATIPANAAPGTWYLIVLADGGQAVAETIETNNKSALAITITLPDLGVSALSAPASAKRGATISVTDTTKNYGTVPAAASTTIYYLSTIKTYDASAIQIGSRNIGMLLKGASSSGSASLTIPAGIATGSYFLIARSDGGEVVAESDEADNTRNATFTVK